MFTGLIEYKGKVLEHHRKNDGSRLVIAAMLSNLEVGESIAVNGVCLTVLPSEPGTLHFDLSPETLKVTNLSELSVGDGVNLERAMCASARFGGHYVSGHVDAVAHVSSMQSMGEYTEVMIAGFSEEAMLYLIPKGSVTVQGVSLTINAVSNRRVTLMLIPHTMQQTTLNALHVGQNVNIEFDYLTRIVAHQLQISGKLNYEVAS